MKDIIYNIGKHSPTISLIYCFFTLGITNIKVYYLLIGYVISIILTLLLKYTILLPTPKHDNDNFLIILNNRDMYKKLLKTNMLGMPSGHALILTFCLTFVSMLQEKLEIFLFVLSIFTYTTSVYYNYHYITQVIVGIILGYLVGYFTFYQCKENLKGSQKEKEDDNAKEF
jgi:membrane-associated phospholipid phosphatase